MKYMKQLFKIIISLVFAGIILTVFSFAYKSEGANISNPHGGTDYVWEPNQRVINTEEGFATMEMDENGYNNKSVPDSIDILLMGSSHMEGLQVSQDENIGTVLAKLLPEYGVYNIGMSGHDIYRSVKNIDDALCTFEPDKYVVIETSTINLSISNMDAVISGTMADYITYDSGLKYYLLKFPLFTNMYNQAKLWLQGEEGAAINDEMPVGYRDVLYNFLSIVSNNAKEHGVVPMVLYIPAQYIVEDGIEYGTDEDYLKIFAKVCQELDIVFIDTTRYADDLYNKEHVLIHGFANSELGKGHMNKYGHKMAAEVIEEYIMKEAE